MSNQDFISTLESVNEHIQIARKFNDPIETCKPEISPELHKLTKSIEGELELLSIKIKLFITQNS